MEGIALNRRAFGVAALVGGSLILSPNGSAQHSSKILSRKQLADLVSTAKTADDHRKLAEHYRAMATQHEVEADEQVELAAKYRAAGTSLRRGSSEPGPRSDGQARLRRSAASGAGIADR